MSPHRRSRLPAWWALPLLAVAAVTALKLGNGFVFDDENVIIRGLVIHEPSRALEVFAHSTLWVTNGVDDPGRTVDTYRPVTLLTFFWDAALSGREPWAYHVTNLLGHLLATWLVLLLARRLLPDAHHGFATIAATLFGLCPALAEAHVWINGRSDVFCVIFGLGGLLLWDRGFDPQLSGARRNQLLWAGGLLFLLGLLCKEVLIGVWPALLFWPTDGYRTRSVRDRAAALLPLAVASGVYLLMRAHVLGGMRTHSAGSQLLDAAWRYPVLVMDGLFHAVAPADLYLRSMRDDYDAWGPGVAIAAAIAAFGLALLAWFGRRREPLLAWASAWFALPLAPVAMIATLLWPGFGRYLYLPMVGMSIALAALLARVWERLPSSAAVRGAARLALGGYFALLAFGLASFIADFRDEETLYRAIVREAPQRAHGYGFLGMHLAHVERPAEAAAVFERAAALDPHEARYLLGYGVALLSLGHPQRALEIAEHGLRELAPPTEFHMLAAASLMQAEPQRARKHLQRCLALEPRHEMCSGLLRSMAAVRASAGP